MGSGRMWAETGGMIFALSLTWLGWIYLAQAWPSYLPLLGITGGVVLMLLGLILRLLHGRKST